MKYTALLRGINVGGARKLPMADLRDILTSLGYSDVSTYLQSGNAVFSSSRDDVAAMEGEIKQAIERALGLDVTVLLRRPDELAAVVAANPFPHALASPSRFFVAFLSDHGDPAKVASLDRQKYVPEEFQLGDRCLYLWCPDGVQASKLTNAFWERRLGLRATSRNWNTVTRLLELAKS
jgi:uncharacterized protein (DUF1697 family)